MQAWRQRKLVLFLGAGISQPYGLPTWNELVLSLLLDESSHAFQEFWPHYRVPLASWLAETFGLSPISMARLARAYTKKLNYSEAQFREYVRNELYRFKRQPQGPTALSGVADLLARSGQSNEWHIPLVVTFNFDDLLEQELNTRGVPFSVVFDGKRRPQDRLAILHVHGYLPSTDAIPDGDIIFTEDEYHRLSFSAFHWSQVELVNLLRNWTVLFVGLSMSDPNLRRLLDASHVAKDGINHWVLRKEYTLAPEERTRAYDAIAEKARLQAIKTGIEGAEKSANALENAVEHMLHLARKYDSDLLHDMGIETIWFKEFCQIGEFLSAIPCR